MQSLAYYRQRLWQKCCDLLPAPNFGKIHTLRDLHRVLYRVHLPAFPKDVPGWMTDKERRALYAVARFCRGPILEIGAWLGRSTVCLGRGIVDSGQKKELLTCELAPTLANYRSLSPGTIGFFYPPESEVNMGDAPLELFERDIKPIVGHPKGVIGLLKENLASAGVQDVVSIFVGDFRQSPARRYGFIFSDAMHSEAEIARNSLDLHPFLEVGSILACHDTTRENEAVLRRYFDFEYSFQADSLFVGQISALKGGAPSPAAARSPA